MTIEFRAQLLPQYLRLYCTGAFTLESALEVYTQAFALAAEQGRQAVLIDARKVTGREPTMGERYDQAVHVAETQQKLSPRIRLAVLGHEPLIHPERFGEIVASNRGAQVKVFTDEDLALDWLLSRPKTP